MLTSITFRNFKALRSAKLPLGRFTLLVGPNGSGKSSVFQGIQALAGQPSIGFHDSLSAGAPQNEAIGFKARWEAGGHLGTIDVSVSATSSSGPKGNPQALDEARKSQVFNLDPVALSAPTRLQNELRLAGTGANLAGFLDRFRDTSRDRFASFEAELQKLMPEFDEVQFEVVNDAQKSFSLRQRATQRAIPARSLSQGTILAVAYLALAHMPDPPPLIGFEEPDRGLHPRLLRDVRAALFRLAYPDEFGESRPPTQIIATTHNPYFVDLFKDHPEDIVIANKVGTDATFERIADRAHYREIIEGAPLGEIWYSGVLGGVPAER